MSIINATNPTEKPSKDFILGAKFETDVYELDVLLKALYSFHGRKNHYELTENLFDALSAKVAELQGMVDAVYGYKEVE